MNIHIVVGGHWTSLVTVAVVETTQFFECLLGLGLLFFVPDILLDPRSLITLSLGHLSIVIRLS